MATPIQAEEANAPAINLKPKTNIKNKTKRQVNITSKIFPCFNAVTM